MILSTPSYIIPGTYLENVEYLDRIKEIKNIELLFFFFDDETERLFLDERDGIAAYKDRFSFTVHMPDLIKASDRRVIELTRDFCRGYVIHPPEEDYRQCADLLEGWRGEFGNIFCIENLIGRDHKKLIEMLPGVPLCCDTGHLLLRGESPARYLEENFERIGEIHLHGIKDGKDHKAIGPGEEWFEEMAPLLEKFKGIVNMEVFNEPDMRSILEQLKAFTPTTAVTEN